ncbi:hypothetical protein ABPG75_002122 [Micractinium tetrahymenae]
MRLLLAILCLVGGAASQRVAIIGGGVAGASAAHYLRQELADVEISVFEREHLGGRAQELQYGGLTLELGASMVWGKNFLMRDLTAAAGLEREQPSAGEGAGLFAVYDGRELVFAESTWRILTLIRLLWRYWLSWFTFRRAPAQTFDKFQGIYALLDQGRTFDSPAELLKAVDLYDLTQQSMFEWLRTNMGTSADLLAAELIGGVNRCNYNQANLELNALAGMVSMLPATEPSVFRIKGGNGLLPPALLAAANASVRWPLPVGVVRRLDDWCFALHAAPVPTAAEPQQGPAEKQAGRQQGDQPPGSQAAPDADAEPVGQPLGTFDAVIIATPLESSGLALAGFEPPHIPARKYRQTVSTFVRGVVRASYFGLHEMAYSAVLVADGAGVPWTSLGLVGRTTGEGGAPVNATVWKLFSREPLPHAWLSMMFERDFEVVHTQVWNSPGAYPAFDPPEDFAPVKLADGLFYAAALENAASAMEIAAIEGRLTAQMAAAHVRALRRGCGVGEAAAAGRDGAAAMASKRDGVLVMPGGGDARAQQEGQLGTAAAAA